MDLLLDTCAFLWLTGESSRLSDSARQFCADPANVLFLSSVSAWEIETKYRLGRLEMAEDPRVYIPTQRTNHRIFALPFEEDEALRHGSLPDIHKDPFDRMLICQALRHGLTILTPDKHIMAYPVSTRW